MGLNHSKVESQSVSRFTTSSLMRLVLVGTLFAGSGATCQRPTMVNPFATPGPAAPQVLAETSSREQIIAAVNQNSARIRSLSVTGARITIPDMMGLPLLTGNIAAERPNRFRLTAGTGLSGQELDLGSNDELFWIWVRRNQPPAVYFCRHDQFANSNIRQVMPVEPTWLLAALGMVDIDPATVYDGPILRRDGRVELHTRLPWASGTLNRVLVIDARRAWVVEQYVYDATGATLLASAIAESHRYFPTEQVSLPDRVAIKLPTTGLALTIDLGNVAINQLPGDPRQLWALPTFPGVPQHDLSGAIPGTPLPGQPLPPLQGSVPAPPYPLPPATGSAIPTAPGIAVPVTNSGPIATSASAAPLQLYGQPRNRTPGNTIRY